MRLIFYNGNRFFIIVAAAAVMLFTSCEKAFNVTTPSTSNTAVFKEMWKVLDEKYALFPVKKTNWQMVFNQFSGQVNDAMSEHDFFSIAGKMLDSLRDGHVSLQSPAFTYTYDGFYTLFIPNFNYNNIKNNYLANNYKTAGPLVYKVVDNVGYIYYSSFSQDINGAQLDTVFNFMTTTTGIMIDVRNNTGGNSENTDKLFTRFINKETLVKYEKIKKGPGHEDFYDPTPFYIKPTVSSPYTKPVALLTNRKCFSACNDFVLYMSYLPNVKIFGDQTGGGGSIPYNYILANGWKLEYSATQTLSPDKEPVENGIATDESIIITPIEEGNGKDPVIEKAFQYLH